ncbi:hypothetical protein WME91_02850 [Sorangium sp. So ce269]
MIGPSGVIASMASRAIGSTLPERRIPKLRSASVLSMTAAARSWNKRPAPVQRPREHAVIPRASPGKLAYSCKVEQAQRHAHSAPGEQRRFVHARAGMRS